MLTVGDQASWAPSGAVLNPGLASCCCFCAGNQGLLCWSSTLTTAPRHAHCTNTHQNCRNVRSFKESAPRTASVGHRAPEDAVMCMEAKEGVGTTVTASDTQRTSMHGTDVTGTAGAND